MFQNLFLLMKVATLSTASKLNMETRKWEFQNLFLLMKVATQIIKTQKIFTIQVSEPFPSNEGRYEILESKGFERY